jgi:hypothetical protein
VFAALVAEFDSSARDPAASALILRQGRRAVRASRDVKGARERATIALALAQLHLERTEGSRTQNLRAAATWYREAVRRFARIGDREMQGLAASGLGLALQEQAQGERRLLRLALFYTKRALVLLRRAYPGDLGDLQRRLADLRQALRPAQSNPRLERTGARPARFGRAPSGAGRSTAVR